MYKSEVHESCSRSHPLSIGIHYILSLRLNSKIENYWLKLAIVQNSKNQKICLFLGTIASTTQQQSCSRDKILSNGVIFSSRTVPNHRKMATVSKNVPSSSYPKIYSFKSRCQLVLLGTIRFFR